MSFAAKILEGKLSPVLVLDPNILGGGAVSTATSESYAILTSLLHVLFYEHAWLNSAIMSANGSINGSATCHHFTKVEVETAYYTKISSCCISCYSAIFCGSTIVLYLKGM